MTGEREGLAEEIRAGVRQHEYALALRTGAICTCGFVPNIEPGSLRAQQDYFADHLADALADLLDARDRRVRGEALRVVRLVESDMAESALAAWRSADARKGLSDHDALLVHADALTRWSERLRMAFDGDDYRADRIEAEG